MRLLRWCALLAAALPLQAQSGGAGIIIGTAYDSLRRAPLSGAEVHVRGGAVRVVADTTGRFRIEPMAPGTYRLELTHPWLDEAGMFALTALVTVDSARPAAVLIASPSLATVWSRLCGRPKPFGTGDTAIAYGTISDAASGTRFAGAGVSAVWRSLRVVGPRDVAVRPLGVTTRTDSLGTYYACGLTTDVTVRLRAYAGVDSSGAIELAPGGGPVTRRDLTVGLAAVRGAALRGVVLQPDGITPVPDAQVMVEEARQRFADARGTFVIDSLPAGSYWLVARAVGFTPAGQQVDLRDGDTTSVRVTLTAAPVVLDTVRVVSRVSKALEEFEQRRRSGFGFMLTEEQVKYRGNLRAVFTGVPQLRVFGTSVAKFELGFTTSDGGTCSPVIFIDGRRTAQAELQTYVPAQIAGIEFYARPSNVPLQYQVAMNACGTILVWTKTLE